VVVASRFEFEAREYGVAIHQGLFIVAFQAHVEEEILGDDLQLQGILRILSLAPTEQVRHRSARISLHSEDLAYLTLNDDFFLTKRFGGGSNTSPVSGSFNCSE
jgi:hypothetical protein